VGLCEDSDQRHGTDVAKQSKVSIETVWHRHRIQDDIELARLSIHLLWVPRYNNLLRTQFQGVLTFALGGSKRHNMSAKGLERA
jgi:hypothetical protein